MGRNAHQVAEQAVAPSWRLLKKSAVPLKRHCGSSPSFLAQPAVAMGSAASIDKEGRDAYKRSLYAAVAAAQKDKDEKPKPELAETDVAVADKPAGTVETHVEGES